VALAKKSFDGLWCEVAMPRADIHHERVGPAGRVWQRLAKTRINRLANHMFDHGAMRCRCSYCHRI
jgi:hypothetical protein